MNDPRRQSSKRTNCTYLNKSKRKRVDQQSGRGLGLKHVLLNLTIFFLTKKLNSLSFAFSMHTSQNTLTDQKNCHLFTTSALPSRCLFLERRGWKRWVPVSGNPDASGSAHTMATSMAYLLLAKPRAALSWKCGRGVSRGNTCRWLTHVVIFGMILRNSTTPSYTDFPLLTGCAGCRTPRLPGEHHSEKTVVSDSLLLTPVLAPCSGLMHLHTFYQEVYHAGILKLYCIVK